MFGDNHVIPAYRWYDKAKQKLYVSAPDAPESNCSLRISQAPGQLLCPSNPRFTTEDWLDLLQRVPLGLINLRNYTTAETRKHLQRLQDASPVPLLIGGDMEHGANMLLDGSVFPRPMGVGAADGVELVRKMGEATAAEGRFVAG